MKIGQNIKELRKSHGWTQKDLAHYLGTTQKVVHDYESEKTKPPVERLPYIARVFGISVDELLGVKKAVVNGKTPHIHKNSRLSKIQEEFSKLSQTEQTAIRKQIRGLIAQKENAQD
jgi:transcriptional regulator with XRE-family HTH domain